jgi:hypothetical protein
MPLVVKMAVQCLACVEQIALGEMNVVDKVGDIAIRQRGLRGSWRRGSNRRLARSHCGYRRACSGVTFLHGELRNDLKLAFVEELKILLLQVGNRTPLAVAHHDRHGDKVDAGAEGNRRFLRGNFRLILCGRSLCPSTDRQQSRGWQNPKSHVIKLWLPL